MNITENQRIAVDLRYAIARDEYFRANPKNIYHYIYQRMVNRLFFVFLVFMAVLALVLSYGAAKGIGMFLAGLATGAVLGLFGYILAVCTVACVSMFCDWIRGY